MGGKALKQTESGPNSNLIEMFVFLKFLFLELFGCCVSEVFFILKCVVDGVSELF